MISKQKRFRGLKRVTPKPSNKNQPKPYKPPVQYDPGIIMSYMNYNNILDQIPLEMV